MKFDLLDKDIQDRRVSQWIKVTFQYFCRNRKKEELTTRGWVEHLFEYRNDLPPHL